MDQQDVKNRMQALLDSLDYDFRQFTLEDFTRWLERRRGRKISFVPWTMPPSMSGAWIAEANGDRDYVFYADETHGIHQAHIKLHELAHMLCGHSTAEVDKKQTRALLRQTIQDPTIIHGVLLRSHTRTSEKDREAETLTVLIQDRVLSNKLQRPTKAVSPNFVDHFSQFTDMLGRSR